MGMDTEGLVCSASILRLEPIVPLDATAVGPFTEGAVEGHGDTGQGVFVGGFAGA